MRHHRLRAMATVAVLALTPLLTAESCGGRSAPGGGSGGTTVVSPAATGPLPAPPPTTRG